MTGLLGGTRATMRAICRQRGWVLRELPKGLLAINQATSGAPVTRPLPEAELLGLLPFVVAGDRALARLRGGR